MGSEEMSWRTFQFYRDAFPALFQADVMEIVIRNPAINLLAARELLDQSGINHEDLLKVSQRFRHGDIQDLEGLARSITITVTLIETTPSMTEDEIFQYFVAHGATRQMIRDLVRPIRSDGLAKARNQMNSGNGIGKSKSRTRAITQQQALCILDAWCEVSAEQISMAMKLVMLHRSFPDCSLAALYALVNEC